MRRRYRGSLGCLARFEHEIAPQTDPVVEAEPSAIRVSLCQVHRDLLPLPPQCGRRKLKYLILRLQHQCHSDTRRCVDLAGSTFSDGNWRMSTVDEITSALPVRFASRERAPPHWQCFGGRVSPLTGETRFHHLFGGYEAAPNPSFEGLRPGFLMLSPVVDAQTRCTSLSGSTTKLIRGISA